MSDTPMFLVAHQEGPEDVRQQMVAVTDEMIHLLSDVKQILGTMQYSPTAQDSWVYAATETALGRIGRMLAATVQLTALIGMYCQSYVIALSLQQGESDHGPKESV